MSYLDEVFGLQGKTAIVTEEDRASVRLLPLVLQKQEQR